MHCQTKKKIKAFAPNILKYLQLSAEEKEWLDPILNDAFRTAFEVIEACSKSELTYEEIGNFVKINKNTAKQIIYALAEGGINFSFDRKAARYFPTGRSRLLIKNNAQ